MYRSMRFGLVLAAAVAATLAFAAPSYAMTDQTFPAGDPGIQNVFVVTYSDFDRAYDVAPLALFDEQPQAVTQRGYHANASMPVMSLRFGAAIRATSKAGWGSGRLRKLAG